MLGNSRSLITRPYMTLRTRRAQLIVEGGTHCSQKLVERVTLCERLCVRNWVFLSNAFTGRCLHCGGSPRADRAWPLAWPSPPGPLGWQRLQGQGSALAQQATRRRRALDAGGASPDNARRPAPVDVTFSRRL